MLTLTKRALSVLAGAALFAGGLATPSAAETRELIFDVYIPARAPITSVGFVGFAKQVEELSGGSLKLTIPAAPMAPPPRIFDIVEDGVADLAVVPIIYRGDQITLPSITDIFGLAKTAQHASIALWRTHVKYFAAADQWGDVMPVTMFAHGDEQLFVKGKAVNTVSDMEGLKLVAPSTLHATRYEALNAVPVGAPMVKMFELVSGGVADGTVVPAGPAQIQGLLGVADNVTVIPGGFSRPAFAVIMNRDVFDSLTPEQQAAILEAGEEALSIKLSTIAQQESLVGMAEFEKAGAVIVEASAEMIEETRARLQYIEQDWLKKAEAAGIDGPAALAYYRSIIAELEGE
ncbi:MAG: hypothetical protein AAGD12_05230 [Pseudomonadota bacterium]